jgi:hypothetical protein
MLFIQIIEYRLLFIYVLIGNLDYLTMHLNKIATLERNRWGLFRLTQI